MTLRLWVLEKTTEVKCHTPHQRYMLSMWLFTVNLDFIDWTVKGNISTSPEILCIPMLSQKPKQPVTSLPTRLFMYSYTPAHTTDFLLTSLWSVSQFLRSTSYWFSLWKVLILSLKNEQVLSLSYITENWRWRNGTSFAQ